MNSWLPCDKWQHLLGSACLFNLIYLGLIRWWKYCPLKTKHLALIVALTVAVLWEVGQAIIWPIDWPDAIGDLIADCAGIIVMWRMAV